MSECVKEEIFLEEVPNLGLLKEEITIEEGHDIDVKEESENTYEDFPSVNHKQEKQFKYEECSVSGDGFSCELCGKSFRISSNLKIHMKRHNKERNHKCSDCGYAAKSKGDLRKHISILHPAETPFQCEVCSKRFSTLPLLKNHSVKHNEERPFKCDECSEAYKWKANLRVHKALMHDNKARLSCNVCGSKFLYQSRLKEHMDKHSKERNHNCSECGYAGKRKGDLIKHISKWHPTETPFQCEVCSKSFPTLPLLKKHSVKHNEERPFKCDECSEAYKWKSNLDSHKALVHDNKATFSCEECGSNFLYRSRLNEHMERHSKARNQKCTDCDYVGKRKWDLIKHIGKWHDTGTPFHGKVCHLCSEEFDTQPLLRRHVVERHGKTPHHCGKCFRNFQRASDLKRHLLTHSEDRTFRCDVCPKTFKTDVSVLQHMRNVHKCVKKFYSCDSCLRKFTRKASLDDHVKDKHAMKEVETFDGAEVKAEPAVLYDPEKGREMSIAASALKEEPAEVQVKQEPKHI